MAEHSPVPWEIEPDSNEQQNIYAADSSWVALLPHQCVRSIELEQLANADFIVRCVNSHDDLLAVCKRIQQQFADEGTYDDALNAAIAKAEAK